MIRNRNSVQTDCHGKELREQGLQLFNLIANEGDIHRYIAGCIPAHWHQELEIFVLMHGSVRIEIGDVSYQVDAGEGCFINSGVLHSFTGLTSKPCIYQSFVFDSGIVGGTPGSIFDTRYVRPLLEEGPSFFKFDRKSGDEIYFQEFEQAFAACVVEGSGYEFQVRESMSKILLYVQKKSQVMPWHKVSSLREIRLKQMLEWMDGHLKEAMTVKKISDAANISPRECQRIFSRYLHYRPIEYVRRRRIFAAAELLAATDIPVTDVAFDCGFSSPSYFTKEFKGLVGSTPTEYRKAVRSRYDGA